MSLIERRRAEIAAKLGSLDCEFQHWKDVTTAPGLGRQQSQVRRITATLEGALEPLRETLAQLSVDSEEVLSNGEAWEKEILAAHSVWEVFRSKLLLRQDDLFKDKLAACDDLAWECYSPGRNLWAPESKGPPLVYFSATWSPFAMSRDTNFQNEVRAPHGAAAALGDTAFQAVLKHLPIPLVSIPWYQVFHLPGAILIAHEIGHVVESDFELSAEVSSAVVRAGLKHPDVWQGWASETFADVLGVCAMGPAFAGTMIDLNATSVKAVQTEDRAYGLYPTRQLRVRVLCEALRKTGHAAAASELLAGWTDLYGEMTTMRDYGDEVSAMVDALLAGPYRGIALTTLLNFPSEWCDPLPIIGKYAAEGNFTALKAYTEPRQLFAAARWLHEHPEVHGPQRYENLLVQMISKGMNAVRAPRPGQKPGAGAGDYVEPLQVQLEAQDRLNGVKLRELMLHMPPGQRAGLIE
jgi:hypothetical protein